MKKILLFLTVFMSAISAFAQDVEISGIYFKLNKEKKTAAVTNNGKKDPTQEVTIPEGNSYSGEVCIWPQFRYDGEVYTVTSIGSHAFYKCPNLTSIEIPDAVTEIEDRAFEHCPNLLSVNKLPSSLKIIGSNAFHGCTSLARIDIPESVEYIGEQAFMNCSSLSSIVIPKSVTSIESVTFNGCTGLKCVNISNSVCKIGSQAFKGCTKLEKVNIGGALSVIEEHAFYECDKLESVTILATTPPEFEWGDEAFSYYGTLHVRKGYKEAYSNAPYWKNFNIVEDVAAGVDDYTYTPMFEKGKVWNFEITHTYPKEKVELVRNYSLTINGDREEDGWWKMYQTFDNEGYDEVFYQEDYQYWVEDKDKVISKVHEYPALYPYPGVILDFNLKTGDQCVVDYIDYYRVVDEDFITVKGVTYRRMHIDVTHDGKADDYWVEGIGTKKYNYIVPFMKPTGGYFWYGTPRLLSVYKDGVCIFERADFDSPGFTNAIEEISCDSKKAVSSIYNLQGQRLNSAPREGIYIKNGKKVLSH